MKKYTSILAVAFVILFTVPALAQDDTVKAEGKQFHALTGLPQAPPALSDKELAAIEGRLANDHATPGLPFANPGTSNAATKIPFDVFHVSPGVANLWFGKASLKP